MLPKYLFLLYNPVAPSDLHPYESWTVGDREEAFDDVFAAMRMQVDLSRGATLFGIMTTSSLNSYAQFIGFALSRPDLQQHEAERIYAELHHVLQDPADLQESLQASLVWEHGCRLRNRDIPRPPGHEIWDEWRPQTREEIVLYWAMLPDVVRAAPFYQDIQSSLLPDRLAAYAREEVRNPRIPSDHWHPGMLARSIRAMDLRMTFALAHLQLHQIAAADAALAMADDSPPQTMDELRSFDPEIELTDPFTLKPIQLVVRDDVRSLRSPALDDPVASGLEHLKNFDHEAYLEIPLWRLVETEESEEE